MTGYSRMHDRRTVLKWFGAALASDFLAYGCSARDYSGNAAGAIGEAISESIVGYGTDPNLNNPVVPWPNTLTPSELDAIAAVCDVMLPADPPYPSASQCAVPEFIDEWMSAPYPDQMSDRAMIISGIDWLNEKANAVAGVRFSELPANQQVQVVRLLASTRQTASRGATPADIYRRLHWLVFGAYYTTPAGQKELRYVGDQPISGDYPGPTPEAIRHLGMVLDSLGISAPWKD